MLHNKVILKNKEKGSFVFLSGGVKKAKGAWAETEKYPQGKVRGEWSARFWNSFLI